MKLYNLSSKLDFGEYKGQTLKDVFMKDPDYVESCILDNPTFCFSDSTLEKLEEIHNEFTFSDEAVERLEEKYEIYEEEENEFDEIENFTNEDLKNFGIIDDNIEDDYAKTEDLDEFESWAESVMDEALDKQKIAMLNKMVGKNFPVGPDATNAIESLKGIIDDQGLKDELTDLADKDPESCARPSIYRYIQKNDPEALDKLDFGDMRMEDDTTDVTIDKDGAMKLAGEEEPKDEKASTEDIIEFVRSFYDKETGAFPKGETGVVISARKRFGDSVGDLVEKFVSKLTGNKVQVEDDEDVEEGSIKYMHSLKAKGHSDEEIAKELNMSADEVKKAMSKTVEDEEKDNKGYTDKEIKMAFGVLNDKRFKGGNYTGAVEVIEKIAKGLSKHPSVAKALQRTNEDLDYITDKLAKLLR